MIRGGTAPDCCGKVTNRTETEGSAKRRIGDALVSMGKALRGEAVAKTSLEWPWQSKEVIAAAGQRMA